jgi:hypothetical protein
MSNEEATMKRLGWVVVLLITSCGGDPGQQSIDKGQVVGGDGKADGSSWSSFCVELGQPPGCDLCEIEGWYGDGTCDTFCPQADVDCATLPMGTYVADDPQLALFQLLELRPDMTFHRVDTAIDANPNATYDGTYRLEPVGGASAPGAVEMNIWFTDQTQGDIGAFLVSYEAATMKLTVFTRADEGFTMTLQ